MTASRSESARAAEALRAQEARHRAMLDAALDCVVTMDHEGYIVDFNPAAERTFGYRADDAVGCAMAELIIPPELRERHRSGLARYLASGEPVLLDRRVEIRGMRADGTTFPVELTITRIDVPGPPTFVGYLRDITDRKAAEAELRASRARIVAAADDARRRLERALHDGAERRLVKLELDLRKARARLMEEPALAGELLDAALGELKEATKGLRELASAKFDRAPSHRCGVTLMDNQVGHAVAAALKGKPGVTVTYTRSMIRVDADRELEFGFDELTDAVGEEFDQDTFEQIMSTHYGRMVALDDRIVLFADPEDAADHLGFDLRDAT
jgi:PAS domain S-box-containing protein